MEIRVYRSFASGMRILSPLPRAGVEQSMCRISAATRTAKLHRRTDIREYPTTAVFVSILFDSSAHSACQFMGDHGLSTWSLLQVTPYLINGTGPRGQSSSFDFFAHGMTFRYRDNGNQQPSASPCLRRKEADPGLRHLSDENAA